MITERTKKSVAKFVEDYKRTVAEIYGIENAESALAEDCTTYYTLDVQVLKTKIKYTTTYTGIGEHTYVESESDDDEVKELLKKWRADMRRARRYWATDSATLDKMADGEVEDINEEEDY
ncbi:MAG: hypothetical protein IKJ78_05940 [Bacteroidales bacterium]|nr:hypothetical protein [Bacteroidales bacterium]